LLKKSIHVLFPLRGPCQLAADQAQLGPLRLNAVFRLIEHK
jgi:hypothetical protein